MQQIAHNQNLYNQVRGEGGGRAVNDAEEQPAAYTYRHVNIHVYTNI